MLRQLTKKKWSKEILRKMTKCWENKRKQEGKKKKKTLLTVLFASSLQFAICTNSAQISTNQSHVLYLGVLSLDDKSVPQAIHTGPDN